MTSEFKPESESKPNGRMFVAIATAMIGAVMFGIDCANFGSVQGFPSFQDEWCKGNYGDEASCAQGKDGAAVNDKWQGDFVSVASVLLFVGAAVGSLALAPWIADGYGRRPCIFIGAAICLVGCLLTSYLSFSNIFVFFMGRFVTGFGIGVCTFALPLYNSEMSAPSIRGATGALFQVNVVLGQMVAAVVTYFCHDWQVGMMLPGIAAVVVAAGVWLTPESPRYIMAKRGYKEGAAILARVRRGSVDEEAKQVMDQLKEEESSGQIGWLELARSPNLRKRVLIACWLQVAQQFTGMNMLIMYSNTVFTQMGFSDPFSKHGLHGTAGGWHCRRPCSPGLLAWRQASAAGFRHRLHMPHSLPDGRLRPIGLVHRLGAPLHVSVRIRVADGVGHDTLGVPVRTVYHG